MKSLLFILSALFSTLTTYSTTAQSWKELDSLGIQLSTEGKYKESITFFEKALKQVERELGREDTAFVWVSYNLASAYSYQRLYDKAEIYLTNAKEIYEKIKGKNNEEYASILTDLAIAYKNQGFYSKAEPTFLEAQNLIEKLNGKESSNYVNALGNLADMYSAQGFYIQAENLNIEAKNISEKFFGKKSIEYAIALNNVAGTYYGRGLFEEVVPFYEEVKEIMEKNDPMYYSIALNNLAFTYNNLSLYDKAEKLFFEKNQLIEKLYGQEHLDYAQALSNTARHYYTRGLFNKADSFSQIAKTIRGKIAGQESLTYAESLADVGMCAYELKNYDEAESFLTLAKAIREKILGETHPLTISSLDNLADLYNSKADFEKAGAYFTKVIDVKLNELQKNYINLNEYQKKNYTEKINLYFTHFYKCIIHILEKQPDYEGLPLLLQTVFTLRLVTKGLLLSETTKMRKQILASGDTSLKYQFEKWQALKNSISRAYNLSIAQREKQGIDIIKLEAEANDMEKQLSARSADFASVFTSPTYTYQDIQKKLGENEVAIEMIKGRRINWQKEKADTTFYYLALVLTPNDLFPVLMDNGKEMDSLHFIAHRRSIGAGTGDYGYAIYWGKIAQAIEKHTQNKIAKVYLSPDGIYHQINLYTLLNPHTQRFLIEDYDLTLLTNLKEIVENQKQENITKTAFLLGRPKYNLSKSQHEQVLASLDSQRGKDREPSNVKSAVETTWGELIGTEKEVKFIDSLLRQAQWQTHTFLAEQAVEERIKQVQNPAILHLATHGYFHKTTGRNNQQGMLNSGIVLAGVNTQDKGSDKEDGVLTALEASNLSLDQTELVVLSACETGLGKVATGEGVYGLQRGFKVAGAKTIIMSLWRVSDAVTQEMMRLFYQFWLSGKTKQQAFKKAQQEMKTKYNSPYLWGAFVMVGE
ncbi:CHAT domain-containing tetratricopeptide repeat protein [Thermoflexibacter ruber]|uniref:Tetratricopeptide repeat-containing protein n=1 Tax=Thermoflexibacter ruber TaxID=1003 RepID=A0A1I2IQG6_9BACT|nr:CHAT domain-containing tetratricopeptide repeat protein [Thermoflexibacter ruber]SFF44519.1 Tetratricopeptide repeat-containing protein [Thermoflexibacter ruber]